MVKRNLITASGVLFLGFLGLVFFIKLGGFVGFDTATTIFLQRIIGRFFDTPLSLFSLLGTSEVTFLILISICLLVYVKQQKFFYSAGLFLAMYVVEFLGKWFLYHPGPPREFLRYSLPFIPLLGTYVRTNYSFPSGHVSRTLFLATVLFLIMPRKKLLRFGLIILVFLMVVSRVYLGEHWLSDVMGGTFLGTATGLLAVVFL